MGYVPTYQQIAILSASDYGCELAIQFANIGFPVYLFDMADQGDDPYRQIKSNIHTLLSARNVHTSNESTSNNQRPKQADVATEAAANSTQSGSTTDDLPVYEYQPEPLFLGSNYPHYILPKAYQLDSQLLYDCDLILCANQDDPQLTQSLLFKLAPYFNPYATLVTLTNSHGLTALAQGLPERLRQSLCGIHWLQPLRYQESVALSQNKQVHEQVAQRVANFMRKVLGKNVIQTQDMTLNVIEDFVCFWLNAVKLLDSLDASDRWIEKEYAYQLVPAVLYQRYSEAAILDWQSRHTVDVSTNSQPTDPDVATGTFKIVLAKYLAARAKCLGISEPILSDFISHYFRVRSEKLANHQTLKHKQKSVGITRGISKILPNLSVLKEAEYGNELVLQTCDRTELNTKQINVLTEYCQKLLHKLKSDEEALVLRFHDYLPERLPEKLFSKANQEKKLHDWFEAWNHLFRVLYSRSVPTILALSGENTGLAAGSALYCSQIIAQENTNILPVCWHDHQQHPVPGYHFGLQERLTWQRGRIDVNEERILNWQTPKYKSWGAANAKQKAWLPRHAILVPNELHYNELVPLYKRMNHHMLSWSASLPDYALMSERHPWSVEYTHYLAKLQQKSST